MKRENELRKIVRSVCDGYTNTIMDAILEENVKVFPITKAVWHFMCELKENNIVMELNDIFIDVLLDCLYREISNYLAR